MKKLRDKKTVVVVEFGSYHSECLYSICLLLKQNGYKIQLALNEKLRHRVGHSLDAFVETTVYYPFGSDLKGLLALFRFYFRLVRGYASRLHVNTAHGSTVWKFFTLPLSRSICISGTLHNVEKLKSSFGQKIITRRIDSYVLLSDLLVPRYKELTNKPMAVVYSSFFPQIEMPLFDKPANEVWIVIPGEVAYNRRDYSVLFNAGKYAPYIRFIILGNIRKRDGEAVHDEIRKLGIEDNFVIFNEFIPEADFIRYLASCDYVMPLVHPEKKHYEQYIKSKISGTYNIAAAFRKPMLCPMSLQKFDGFADTSFFYDVNDFAAAINRLQPSPDTSHLWKLDKWTVEDQLQRIGKIYEKV